MGVMDKFINYMKLNPEDDYEGYEDDYDDPLPEDKTVKRTNFQDENQVEEVKKVTPKVSPISKPRKTANGMDVCVIKPTSVEDAREITETLLANQTVVLNLEGLDVDIAQRIIDFTSGSCFAINGNLQKISHYIFIITPAIVSISGDFQDILAGSFDMNKGL